MRLFLSRTRKSVAPSLSLVVLPAFLAGFSTSIVALDSPGAASSSSSRQLTQASISKMSNGEGYIENVSPRASKLIQDSIDLFSAKPSHEIFERSWAGDKAVFEDPLCYAKGERQYKAQWWGLAAAFSKCELLAWHVTKDEPNQVNYVQRQRYTFRGLGITKEIISTISMKLDEDGKVIHMQDRWNHQDPPANFIAWPLRRLNAVSVPLFVTIPPNDAKKPSQHSEL